MKWAIFLLFTSAICAMLWMWQVDNHITETAYIRLKNGLDRATHDAALQINYDELARNGRIAFSDEMNVVLLQSLRHNPKLDERNMPVAPNMFRSSDDLQVLHIEKIETGCPGSAIGFPCIYMNSEFDYIDSIRGPSVVAIISMRHPRPFAFSADSYFIVGSAHEYVGY